jgi:hypothetical protein
MILSWLVWGSLTNVLFLSEGRGSVSFFQKGEEVLGVRSIKMQVDDSNCS